MSSGSDILIICNAVSRLSEPIRRPRTKSRELWTGAGRRRQLSFPVFQRTKYEAIEAVLQFIPMPPSGKPFCTIAAILRPNRAI